MPAQCKEVVQAADSLDLQNLLPDAGQRGFQLTHRGFETRGLKRSGFGRGQHGPVGLAVGGEREPIEPDPRRGQHVFGQEALELGTQGLDGQGFAVFGAGEVGHQAFVARHIFPAHDHRLANAGAGGEPGLDLTQLDAEAAELDLMVAAADVLDAAVGQPAADVAGPVQARARLRTERVLDEALGSQLRLVVISPRHADAAHEQLTPNARHNGLHVLIKDVDRDVGDRTPDRRGACVLGLAQLRGDKDRGFGRTVDVDEAVSWRPPARHGRWADLAGDHQGFHRREVHTRAQRSQCRRRQRHVSDAVALQGAHERVTRQHGGSRRKAEPGTVAQGHGEVEHAGIEAGG